jgi:lipopolysaccharide transport system ATP-binding protein
MSDTVVRVESLSKKYTIGHQKQKGYTTLRESMTSGVKGLLQPFRRGKPQVGDPDSEEFWALKDVSFEIKQGDRVGIIGRNGAGKSTLLKILSRIIEPTSGRIGIKGRVASLLEVGTGFHPELTGRENISLNGAILGMSKAEITRKFDEIVAFAEVERFLDTPVKRYSSGMYVRLAFSVAAHLEPEILIVDEVLAVGDASFQEKCLGKMEDINKNDGRTIIFVSHNIAVVQKLCSVAILLKKGEVVESGGISDVIYGYLEASPNTNFKKPCDPLKPTLIEAWLENPIVACTKYIELNLEIYSPSDINSSIDLLLSTPLGVPVGFGSVGTFDYSKMICLKSGINKVQLHLETASFAIGQYFISIDLTEPTVQYFDRCANCLKFDVVRSHQENIYLEQSWSYGSVEFPVLLASHSLCDQKIV